MKIVISKEDSIKIQQLKLILIILIVFLHAHITTIYFKNTIINHDPGIIYNISVNFISETITRAAVPLFFLISAFLFFKERELTKDIYFSKIKSRIKTLFIPFILWNTIILVFLYSAQSIPALANFFSQRRWATPGLNIWDISNALFGITRDPILFQFWFLRDLIIFVIFSPLIWIITRKIPYLSAIIILILYFLPIQDKRLDGLLFFFLGSLCAYLQINFNIILKYKLQIGTITILLLILDALFLTFFNNNIYFIKLYPVFLIHRITILSSIAALWVFLSIINKEFSDVLSRFAIFSFFIYAIHEPTSNIIRKILYSIHPPKGDFELIAYYLITPVATITTCILVALVLKKRFNRFYNILTGDRA